MAAFHLPLAFLSSLLVLTYFTMGVTGINKTTFAKPEDILTLEEITIVQLKSVWNSTHATYALYGSNSTGRIKTFWNNLKSTLAVVTDLIRAMERKIIVSQPSTLLNKLFELQELDALREVSETPSNDPVIHWKVKWVELSSLATHIHWLFNKRMRDIMNNVPHIKTVANSLAKYYGNPWYSKLSGRPNNAHRYPMRDFPRWIDTITFNTPKGDLFYGLRQLIDNCKLCRSGAFVHKGACLGGEAFAKIEPVRMDAPIYVFFYLCLVDIKFYILKNFFHIYREAYENIPFTNYSIFDDRLQTRLRRKLDVYSNSFKDYDDGQNQLEPKLSSGYFHCDPIPSNPKQNKRDHVYKKTFIKLTNFATDFVVLERELTPSGGCSSTCKELGRADTDTCQKSDEECAAEFYPECLSNPRLCELFKSRCPLADLVCYKSATSAKVCPSTVPDRLMEWTLLNNTQMYPKDQNTTCSKKILQYNSTMVRDPGTGKMELCEVCLCQCLEPLEIHGKQDSIRVFSQKESVSLIEENRIMVGIKFEQVENQIHIKIADAISLPGLKANMSSVVWRDPTPADPNNETEIARIGRNLRAIHIDDWKAPDGFVVTGIRFVSKSVGTMNTHDYQPYLGMKLRVTKVNTKTGKLIPAQTQWIMNAVSGAKSTYKYSSPNDPVKADGPAIPDSSTNQLIYFRATALTKTNVNEVVPYFDAQEVILPEKVSALSGIGIYHKGKPGFGGFLGWKIIPY